jgi:dTDP-4-amino-4,6-dideoxygalactose transaminase
LTNTYLHLSVPEVTQEDMDMVAQSLKDGWVAPAGPYLKQFEDALSDAVGGGHAVALSSGTAALHLALIVAGVQAGDEVLCSTFTFIASANPIVYLGAKPIFVDSEERTWNLDAGLLEKFLVARRSSGGKIPRFLMLVHIYGQPAEMERIQALCEEYQIILIEDAAEALGASYNGRPVGRFGQIAAFSFNGNKVVTTAGGGALVTDNKEWADRARYLAAQAKDASTDYYHSALGYNYRMSSMAAALGISQLSRLKQNVQRKRQLFDRYVELLADIPAVIPMPNVQGAYESRWLSSFFVDSARSDVPVDKLIRALVEEGIEARTLWHPLHLQPIYRDTEAVLSGVAERLHRSGISIASSTTMTDEDQQRVVSVIRRNLI